MKITLKQFASIDMYSAFFFNLRFLNNFIAKFKTNKKQVYLHGKMERNIRILYKIKIEIKSHPEHTHTHTKDIIYKHTYSNIVTLNRRIKSNVFYKSVKEFHGLECSLYVLLLFVRLSLI